MAKFSPILASRIGADAAAGIPKVVEDVRRAVGLIDRYKQISSLGWKAKLKKLDCDIGHAQRVEEFSRTEQAIGVVAKAANELIDAAWKAAEELVVELSAMRLHLPQRKNERHYFSLAGPKRLTLHMHFSNRFTNSIEGTRLTVRIFRAADDWDEESKVEILKKIELWPAFDGEMNVFWKDAALAFSSGAAVLDFAFETFVAALSADQ